MDIAFTENFTEHGTMAFHVGGHTPGFTFYIHEDILFICDYAYPAGERMRLNTFGPRDKTLAQAKVILETVRNMPLGTVCGYNYVMPFKEWISDFERAILRQNSTSAG